MNAERTAAAIEQERLIAIVRLESEVQIRTAVEELIAAEVRFVEFSMAAPGALDALQHAIEQFGDRATFGAGTVRTAEDATRACGVGAGFLVSPNLDRSVVEKAGELGVLQIPGAFSPTEVATAISAGAPLVKLFPASSLGPGYVRDLLAPFPDARLVPTGGVDERNARDFLDAGAAALAVGSSLVSPADDRSGGTIAARGRRFRELISTHEKGGST